VLEKDLSINSDNNSNDTSFEELAASLGKFDTTTIYKL
jgi:hypothetical protein